MTNGQKNVSKVSRLILAFAEQDADHATKQMPLKIKKMLG
jgi:hypothetical protein